ncbi:hypothetical protein [Muricoccus radiodurans]|uniref:hypothetical protein n=1 Tax=Muricoccus radiodurans TaxID=2231721 RepID=UPI003CEAE844
MRFAPFIALAGLALASAAEAQPRAPAQPGAGAVMPRLVIGAPGRCEMTVDGQSRPCTSGLVYVHHTNGSVLVSVQSGQGVTIGFQADSDRQPRPEQYILDLTRMHTSINGQTAAKTVTGSCEISVSTDGQTWHRATCRATDGNGMVTAMTFTGSGQPVTVARPGQEGRRGATGPAAAPGNPAPNAPRTGPAANPK